MSVNNLGQESVDEQPAVFIVVNTFGRGGAEMSLAILANELAKLGRRVTLIALWRDSNSYNFDWLAENGVQLLVLHESKNVWVSFCKLFMLLNTKKIKLIYSAMLYANFVSQICAFLLGVTHIASVRNNPAVFYDGSLFKRISFMLIMSLQNSIVFISQRALDEYLATGYGRLLRKKQFFVLHNPIANEEIFEDGYLEKKFSDVKKKINDLNLGYLLKQGDDAVLNFVIVSRLVDGKGIIETLEQIRIPFNNQRLHLSIYGAGPLENQIRDFIDREFIHKNVVLKGFCTNINKIFADSDIIIFPSRSEGFGRAPFEALLRGNLVLCNYAVSIVNEFLHEPMAWNDYSEPFDVLQCIEGFAHLEPLVCIEQVKKVSSALSPCTHAREFEKIASACIQR